MFSFGQQRKHHRLHPITQPTTTIAIATATTIVTGGSTTAVGTIATIPTTTDVIVVVVIVVGGGVLSGVDISGGGVERVGSGFHGATVPYGR